MLRIFKQSLFTLDVQSNAMFYRIKVITGKIRVYYNYNIKGTLFSALNNLSSPLNFSFVYTLSVEL